MDPFVPPPWPPWPWPWRRKWGCGLEILIVIIIVILILLRACDDGDDAATTTPTSPSRTTTTVSAPTTTVVDPTPPPGAAPPTVLATTSTTQPRVPATTINISLPPTTASPGPDSAVTSTDVTPVPVDPLFLDAMRRGLDALCLPAGTDAAITEAIEELYTSNLVVLPTSGPDPGDTPPPLGSGDPGLQIERAGLARDECEDKDVVGMFMELGAPSDAVQLSVGLDFDPNAGPAPNPNAPAGLGQTGGFDRFCSVGTDGTTFYSDGSFDELPGDVLVIREGPYVVVVLPDETGGADVNWLLQTFRRDGNTAASPVDWVLLQGTLPAP